MSEIALPEIKLKRPKGSTSYDGFDLVGFNSAVREINLEAKTKELPEPYPFFKTFIPLEWKKKRERWFWATDVSKCLRRAGYKALGVRGEPFTVENERKMEVGTSSHWRLGREFKLVALAPEITIFDPENGIYGKCDLLARNWITGELFVVDFKTIDEWFYRSRLLRAGLPPHLKNTPFYPGIPDDVFQVMLYIRMWRMLIRYPEIPIRFGLVIYENRNNPNERKSTLVEYDEELMKRFFSQLHGLNAALDKGENIPPYIPVESYVHQVCPYRFICPRGKQAIIPNLKRKNIPLWIIYNLRKRAKQPVPEMPVVERQQTLFALPPKTKSPR